MKEKINILISEIKNDHKKIERLLVKFDRAYSTFLKNCEYSKLVEAAYYVNQVYSGFERIFKNVTKAFENEISQNGWHKSLLDRVSLEIEDIRPALISGDSFRCLDELRSFRHFFRHAYDIDIDSEKFAIIAKRVDKLKVYFKGDIAAFLHFLDRLRNSEQAL